MRSKTTLVALALVLIALAAPSVSAQIVFGQPGSGGLTVVYSHWKADYADSTEHSGTVDQTAFPITAFVPLADNFEAIIYASGMTNSLEVEDTAGSSASNLNGMADVRVQLNRSFHDDTYLLSLGVRLPTGKKDLDAAESVVLMTLSQDFVEFPVRSLGSGLGFNALAGMAHVLGEYRVGGSVSYTYKGKYDPYAGAFDYDPGDQIGLALSVERPLGAGTIAGDVSVSMYGQDKMADQEVFKQSTMTSVGLRYAYQNDMFDFAGGLKYVARGRNEVYTNEYKLNGDEFRLSAHLTRRLSGGWYVGPGVDFKRIAAADDGLGVSKLVGVGAAMGKQIGEKMSFELDGRYFTGEADDGIIDLSGMQISLGLTANL